MNLTGTYFDHNEKFKVVVDENITGIDGEKFENEASRTSEFTMEHIAPKIVSVAAEIINPKSSPNTAIAGDTINITITFDQEIKMTKEPGKMYQDRLSYFLGLNARIREDGNVEKAGGHNKGTISADEKSLILEYVTQTDVYAFDGSSADPLLYLDYENKSNGLSGYYETYACAKSNGLKADMTLPDIGPTTSLAASEILLDCMGPTIDTITIVNDNGDGTVSGTLATGFTISLGITTSFTFTIAFDSDMKELAIGRDSDMIKVGFKISNNPWEAVFFTVSADAWEDAKTLKLEFKADNLKYSDGSQVANFTELMTKAGSPWEARLLIGDAQKVSNDAYLGMPGGGDYSEYYWYEYDKDGSLCFKFTL